MLVGLRQLQAEDERLDAAQRQEHERRHDVADAERLVVDRRQPAVDARRCFP